MPILNAVSPAGEPAPPPAPGAARPPGGAGAPRPGRRRATLLPLGLGLALLALGALGLGLWWTRGPPGPGAVSFERVQPRSFTLQVHERGSVRPARVVRIKSKLSSNQAKLVWMHPEGQPVTRGQIVARFDTKPFNDALLAAEQNLLDARTRHLSAEKAYEIQREDNAARLEAANRKLEIARIKAEDLREGTGQLERRRRTLAIEQATRAHQIARDELADFEEMLRQGYISERERDIVADRAQQALEALALARAELTNFDRYERPRLVREAELLVDAANTEVARVRRVAALELTRREEDVIKQRRDARVAQTQLEGVREELRNCDVRAPIDGNLFYVDVPQQQQRRKAQTGDAIWFGQTFLEIPDTRELVVQIGVREIDLARLAPGMTAHIDLDALPGRSYEGELVSIGSLAQGQRANAVRRFEGRVRFVDPPPDVRVGMSADVRLDYRTLDGVIAVPAGAIEYHGGSARVRVRDGERSVAREVVLGEAGTRWVEVRSGLRAGEEIEVGVR